MSLQLPAIALAMTSLSETVPALPVPVILLQAQAVASIVEPDGAAKRLLEAGALRTLNQRIASDVCAWRAGIPGAETDLRASADRYGRILRALEVGDLSMGIPSPERDRRILADIRAAQAVWTPLHDALGAVPAGGPTPETVRHVLGEAEALTAVTTQMIGAIAGQYAIPSELVLADAIAIDLASRQEGLAGKIAKDVCRLFLGLGDAAAERAELAEAVRLFDLTLTALREGMPEAGLIAPPTDAIGRALAAIQADWTGARAVLDPMADGAAYDLADVERAFGSLHALTDHMAAVTLLYAEASQLDL